MTTPTDKFIIEFQNEFSFISPSDLKDLGDWIRQALKAQRAEIVSRLPKEKEIDERCPNCEGCEKRKCFNDCLTEVKEVLNDIEEIPQMKGTQEALDKLTIR